MKGPQAVTEPDHASQGLKVGLYTPTILGGNSYLRWCYDRGPIKDPAHAGTSKWLSQAINRGTIRKFLPKHANVYVTIQSHGLSVGVQTHYVTAYRVRIMTEHTSPAGLSTWRCDHSQYPYSAWRASHPGGARLHPSPLLSLSRICLEWY